MSTREKKSCFFAAALWPRKANENQWAQSRERLFSLLEATFWDCLLLGVRNWSSWRSLVSLASSLLLLCCSAAASTCSGCELMHFDAALQLCSQQGPRTCRPEVWTPRDVGKKMAKAVAAPFPLVTPVVEECTPFEVDLSYLECWHLCAKVLRSHKRVLCCDVFYCNVTHDARRWCPTGEKPLQKERKKSNGSMCMHGL